MNEFKLSTFVQQLSDAGASPEVIALAVSGIEFCQEKDRDRRQKHARRMRASRERARTVTHCDVTVQHSAITKKPNEINGCLFGTELANLTNTKKLEIDSSKKLERDSKKERKKESSDSFLCVSKDDSWPPDWQDQFWRLYPNKVGKADALQALEKTKKRGIFFPTIIAGLRRYVNKTDDRPWCNPGTWVRQERWDDQPAEVTKRNGNANPSWVTPEQARKGVYGVDWF